MQHLTNKQINDVMVSTNRMDDISAVTKLCILLEYFVNNLILISKPQTILSMKNFYEKIKICNNLGLLNKEDQEKLIALKSVRNKFVHDLYAEFNEHNMQEILRLAGASSQYDRAFYADMIEIWCLVFMIKIKECDAKQVRAENAAEAARLQGKSS